MGKVDRLSGSGNAIVEKGDIECIGSRRQPSSEVNLGDLPRQVVGQTVVFAFDGGTYGTCLTERWVTDDYLAEMEGKSGVNTDTIEIPVVSGSQDIVEDIKEEELITASSELYKESIVYEGREIENVVIVECLANDEGDRYFLAVMDGPLVPRGGTPVTVTGIQGDFVTVESCYTAHEDTHPNIDGEIMVEVVEQLVDETMSVTETGIPVFVSTGQYQVENELRVKVIEKTESHFVGEVVLDVDRESVGVDELDTAAVENRGHNKRIIWNGIPIDVTPVQIDDLEPNGLVITGKNAEAVEAKWDLPRAVEDDVSIQAGNKITFEIRDANGYSCIGSYHGYPVVCSGIRAFPVECEGKRIRGVIENIEPDKATVSLQPLPETKQELELEILGVSSRNGVAVVDEYLVRLPEVRFVSAGDEVSVVVTNRGGDITEVSAGECTDAHIGNDITFEITEANGDSCIGSYQDFPVVCSGIEAFPDECTGRQIKGQVEEHKSDRLTVSLVHPPETDQEKDVEVLGRYGGDAIAVADGCLVSLPDVRFVSAGDEVSVVITNQGGDITEVSAGECTDAHIGNDITFEITEANGNSCIGSYQDFPVVCSDIGAFPDECEGRQIKARVQERKSDRLTVSLAHPPEADQELDVEVLGRYGRDGIAVADEYLVKIPEVELDSRSAVFRVGVLSRGDPITEVSVAARDLFQTGDEPLLVRLPETTGRYTIIDGEPPAVTSHLPDIDSPVTLGVANVNTDSVVPTVTALPKPHVPEVTNHITTAMTNADEMFATGVGEELPVEFPVVDARETDTVEVKIGVVERNRVLGLAVGVGDQDVKQFPEYYVSLQIADLAYKKQKYEKAREMLIRARDQLPSEELVLDAILTAHIPLIDLVCATDITNIQPSEIEEQRERLTSLRGEIEETDIGEEINAYLHAYDLELKAAQNFIRAVNEATQDTRNSLQSIARGYDSKEMVMEGVAHIERTITFTAEAGFSTFVPSNELRMFVEELRQSYPIPVDELDQVPKPKSDTNWLSYFLSGEDTGIIQERFNKTDDEVEGWKRPSVPNDFGVWTAESAESIGEESMPENMAAQQESNRDTSTIETEADETTATSSEERESGEGVMIADEKDGESDHSVDSDSDTLQPGEGQASGSRENESEGSGESLDCAGTNRQN